MVVMMMMAPRRIEIDTAPIVVMVMMVVMVLGDLRPLFGLRCRAAPGQGVHGGEKLRRVGYRLQEFEKFLACSTSSGLGAAGKLRARRTPPWPPRRRPNRSLKLPIHSPSFYLIDFARAKVREASMRTYAE